MSTELDITPEFLDLNLLVMYLSRLEVDDRKKPGKKEIKVWKGYLVEVVTALREQGFLRNDRNIMQFCFTEEGLRKGEQLKSKFLCA